MHLADSMSHRRALQSWLPVASVLASDGEKLSVVTASVCPSALPRARPGKRRLLEVAAGADAEAGAGAERGAVAYAPGCGAAYVA